MKQWLFGIQAIKTMVVRHLGCMYIYIYIHVQLEKGFDHARTARNATDSFLAGTMPMDPWALSKAMSAASY